MTIETKNVWAGAAANADTGFAEAARRAWREFRKNREYRKAVAHVQAMSDRELRDI